MTRRGNCPECGQLVAPERVLCEGCGDPEGAAERAYFASYGAHLEQIDQPEPQDDGQFGDLY